MTGVFPLVLKTAKVVPVFKKDSNAENILQKHTYETLYTLLNNNNIMYILKFGFR